MTHPLIWNMDWADGGAECIAPYGTYVIARRRSADWLASFTRTTSEASERTALAVSRQLAVPSLADAMRSCQRHADNFKPESSGRLQQITPLPD